MVPSKIQLAVTLLFCLCKTVFGQDAPSCRLAEVNYLPEVATWLQALQSGEHVALFHCLLEDQELRGIGFKVCQNGRWSDPDRKPRCAKFSDCPRLPPIADGRYNATFPYRYNVAVAVICNQGFSLMSGSIARCRLRGWSQSSNDLGSCVKTCRLPTEMPSPLAFNIQGQQIAGLDDRVPVGTNLRFYCAAPGHKLTNSSLMRCTDRGWSKEVPRCKVRKCRLNLLLSQSSIARSNTLSVSPRQQRYDFNTRVRISCQADGFYLDPAGVSSFQCATDVTKKSGQLVWTYQNGQRVTSPLEVTCQKYCEVKDIALGAGASYLHIRRGVLRVGEELKLRCGNHRRLRPQSLSQANLSCSDGGIWTLTNGRVLTRPVACHATSCTNPEDHSQWLHHSIDEVNGQDTATFSCGSHELVGSNTSLCTFNASTGDRNWIPPWPECRQKVVPTTPCQTVSTPENGRIVSRFQEPYPVNATIGIECDRCYKPSSQEVASQCKASNGSSVWMPDLQGTTCIARMCSPLSVEPPLTVSFQRVEGADSACGTVARFECPPLHSLVGDATLTCLPTRRWSGCIPKCIRSRCGSLESPGLQCDDQELCGIEKGTQSGRRSVCTCLSSEDCPDCEEANPVCGTDGKTYRSSCHLRARSCQIGRQLQEVGNINGPCIRGGICSQSKPVAATGTSCAGHSLKWFFNTETRTCQIYSHGSCTVGENSFDLETECKKVCARAPDPCKEPPHETGNCLNFTGRPYYSYGQGSTCTAFQYSGCGGNGNRFADMKTCLKTCSKGQKSTDPEAIRAVDGSCHGRPCPSTSMREACPANDTNVVAFKGRVATREGQPSPALTYFQALGVQFKHKPTVIRSVRGFVFYSLLRLDGGDRKCGCPDFANGNFFVIGRAVRQQGQTLLLVDERSYVQQYSGSGAAAVLESQFKVACPHLNEEVMSTQKS